MTPTSSDPIDAPARTDGYDTDVVVIGAGPVGLTLGCALAHHGVRFRILEQRTEPDSHSKANNVWSRPQELLASIGVRDALAESSYAVHDVKVLLDGVPLDSVPVSQVTSPYNAVLYTGQNVIESTLTEQLKLAGREVERGRRVRTLDHDANGVDVMVGPADGENGLVERIRCRYVVGADGTNSITRAAIEVDIGDELLEGRATRQVDAKLTWRRPTDPNQLWFFTYHEGFAGVMPVWGGYHRLFFLEDEALVGDRDPTLPEMQDRAREVTGDPTVTLTDPIWFSHGRFKHGVAPTYAHQRVFLAGDAGHHTLPIGGQGMNAGIHDAVGLGWRLAMVQAGDAGPAVLDSYSTERQGAHAALDADQTSGFRRLMYRSRVGDAALKVAGEVIPNLGSKMFGADDLQQLAVAYPDSPLSAEHFSSLSLTQRGAPKAGDRAPDARVVATDGNTTSLFSHIYNPDGRSAGWCLLAFDGRDAGSRPALARAVEAVATIVWVHPRLVLADPQADEHAAFAPRLFDLDGEAHAAYGLDGNAALVLVRPDGHIALRAPADQTERLQQYCQRIADGAVAGWVNGGHPT